jgi:hypothetical protein
MWPPSRLLFRLLAEDTDPTLLAELRPAGRRRGSRAARSPAVAGSRRCALAQAGFEADPRLAWRGASAGGPRAQLLQVAAGPEAVGAHRQPACPAAEVAAPSFHLLVMLDTCRSSAASIRSSWSACTSGSPSHGRDRRPVQQVGEHLHRAAAAGARGFPRHPQRARRRHAERSGVAGGDGTHGFLGRHEGWVKLLDRTLDDRGRRKVWTPPRSMACPSRSRSGRGPSCRCTMSRSGRLKRPPRGFSADVTFRLALIARLAGRTLDSPECLLGVRGGFLQGMSPRRRGCY